MSLTLENKIAHWMEENLPLGTKKIAVAVSGGCDSLCLTLLLKEWAESHQVKLYAYTVNHGLRKEAQQEAQQVHQFLTQQKIKHTILTWTGKKPTTSIEEKARIARYHLLTTACQKEKINYLFLAHHLEDQVETFWARLCHKSGLDGLCGMNEVGLFQNLFLMRPLLNEKKSDLKAYLKKKNCPWFEDSMNQDEQYERVRWRKNQPILDKMGLTSPLISGLTSRLKREKEAIDFYVDSFIKNSVFLNPAGYIFISRIAWEMIPMAVRIKALIRLLPKVCPNEKPVSLESIENILLKNKKSATLSGCQILIHKKGIFISKELRNPEKKKIFKSGESGYWDRFWISTPIKLVCDYTPPSPRIKDIPYLVQKTFPPMNYKKVHFSIETGAFCGIYFPKVPVCTQKELEKKVLLDYKKGDKILYIHFNPRKIV